MWWLAACTTDLAPVTPYVRHADPEDVLDASDPDVEPPPPAEQDPCAGDPLCTDVSSVPTLWLAEDGWVGESWWLAGDLNADGLADALWTGTAGDGEFQTLVVYGPLVRERVLPRDADVVIHGGAGHLPVGDANGDKVVDLPVRVLIDGYLSYEYVVPGPLPAGDVDPKKGSLGPWLDHYEVIDQDADGVLELLDFASRGYRVWMGEAEGWAVGEPDLELVQHCGFGDANGASVVPMPDLDGDGRHELCAYDECGSYLMPPGTTGKFTLGDPVFPPITCVNQSAGDQTGDGVVDYMRHDELVLGPLSWDSDGAVTSALVKSGDPGHGYQPLPVDMDGDGFPEFLSGRSYATYGELLLFSGGPNGGFSTGIYRARFSEPRDHSSRLPYGSAFLEGRDLHQLVVAPDGVGFAGMGYSEPVPLQ